MTDKTEATYIQSLGHGRSTFALTSYLYALMTIYAVSITMIGPMMPHIIDEYGLRLSQGGLILTFQSIGGILAIIIVGIVSDAVKKPRLILTAYLSFGLALFMVGYIRSFPVLLAVFFLFGAGTRISDTVLNAYVSDIHTSRRGVFLNLLHSFFGVGAFIGPMYARYLLEQGIPWNRVFSFLGLACIFIIIFMPIASKKVDYTKDVQKTSGINQWDSLLKSPIMWILGIIMIMYVGHQSSIIVWMPMYMETVLRVSPTVSSLAISVFWLGIIVGRLLCSHLTKRFSAISLLLGGCFLGGLVLTAGLAIKIPNLLILCLGFTGLFTGAAIPLLVTIACDRFPHNSGTASSMIFICGSISTLIFPWLVGTIAEVFNFQWAMLLSGLILLAIAGMTIFIQTFRSLFL
ncbi:MAG: MFS transporter [Firmicutes bacterium]|nr:MFS transporter [Bacillota bacterium]